jgi:ribosome-associated protein
MLMHRTASSNKKTTFQRKLPDLNLSMQSNTSLMSLEDMKLAVVDALEDIKAFDITVMDVREMTAMTSYMIVASGNSTRQCKAIADNVREKLKEKGMDVRGVEGEKEGEWVLVDLGDIVVHVMVPTTRAYYNIEQLWSESQSRRAASAA